jgi:TRAP transporter TAXI family solute receptor
LHASRAGVAASLAPRDAVTIMTLTLVRVLGGTIPHRPVSVKRLAQLAAALLLCACMTGAVEAADLGLSTGAERGTYYRFGQDLRRLLKPNGIDITVYPSNGAVDNVHAITERPGIQLGIVQSDVLAAIASQQRNNANQSLGESVRLVFPLYDEEVHILARGGINDLNALAGRYVAIGREGSGTYLTAAALFRLARVVPAAMVAIDAAEALAQLRAGRIDAIVYVAGHPVRLLRDAVKPADGFVLVPVTVPAILDAYAATEIPAGTYPWQRTAVPTVAVTAVLVAHDPGRRFCETIGEFARHVIAGRGWLVQNGHPYWERVDLQRPVKGWQQYNCVRDYIDSPAATVIDRHPITDVKDGSAR